MNPPERIHPLRHLTDESALYPGSSGFIRIKVLADNPDNPDNPSYFIAQQMALLVFVYVQTSETESQSREKLFPAIWI